MDPYIWKLIIFHRNTVLAIVIGRGPLPVAVSLDHYMSSREFDPMKQHHQFCWCIDFSRLGCQVRWVDIDPHSRHLPPMCLVYLITALILILSIHRFALAPSLHPDQDSKTGLSRSQPQHQQTTSFTALTGASEQCFRYDETAWVKQPTHLLFLRVTKILNITRLKW